MEKLLDNLLVAYAPEEIDMSEFKDYIKVFLAGTIDLGDSDNWQNRFITALSNTLVKNAINDKKILILNPRRSEWNGTPTTDNQEFNIQVDWELKMMEESDIIFMNLLGGSKSPVSLIELGLNIGRNPNKLVVKCPPSFYRFGNVSKVCERYGVKLISNPKISVRDVFGDKLK